MKTLLQLAKETGISRNTLLGRAKVLKIQKLGDYQYMVSEIDEKRLLDPTLHKVGGYRRKKQSSNT